MNDLRYAIRMLLKNPGFTTVAVLTLALGIGANTTVFSIINAIVLKPVSIRHPEQIVGVYQHDRDDAGAFNFFSYPDFADLRSVKEAAFSELFAIGFAPVTVLGDVTEKISAGLVSANYFPALGVPPALGRGFLPEEETAGASVAVLSDSFWKRLGADPSIIGRRLKLARGEVTVIGVMPPGFTGAQLLAPPMFLPIGMADALSTTPGQPAARILTDRGDRRFMLMGRLKPGLTLANVNDPLSILNRQFAIPNPNEPKARTLVARPPARFNFGNQPEQIVQDMMPVATLAFALSTLVMLIACLNLANMMLARGMARRKEIALRLALGARRRRILEQLLTEGLLLGLLGSFAGLLGSMWATKLLGAFIHSALPPSFPKLDFAPDGRVLVTLIFLGVVSTLFFALGPAWKLTRLEVTSDLKRHAGEDAQKLRPGRFGARDLLAVGQMAAALALLVAAVLFTRSAIKVARANPGFEFGSNFYLALEPGLTGYPAARVRDLIIAATDRLSAMPGVESVSPAMNIPFGDDDQSCAVQLGGAPPLSDGAVTYKEGKGLQAYYNVVGADYFRTLGLPLRRGREFERREVEATNSPPVAIISQNLADQLWPGLDPLGRSIQFPHEGGRSPMIMRVVGVVPAIDWNIFEKQRPADVYVPLSQDFQANLKLHVRVAPGVDPAKLMTTAREELRRLDAGIPLTEVKTLADLHRNGVNAALARLGSMLFGAFGALAMGLSFLGIYGLKAYAVARRTREIGIRMAVGANRRDVMVMILRETAWLAGLGLGLGLLLALAAGKLAASFLYQVSSTDPMTFIAVPLLLFLMTLAACVIPARRAARVEPMTALRSQ